VPGLKEAVKNGTLKEAGIDKVFVFCVNDGAVMTAWKKDQGVDDPLIEFVADTQAALTTALNLVITHPGPNGVLGAHTKRCKRSATFVCDGIVKACIIAEKPDDPAGDAFPEVTLIENVLPTLPK